MLRKFKPFQASSTIEFKDPDTGRLFRAGSYPDLYRDITSYRDANQLETLEQLDKVVENYLCGLPENANRCKPYELERSLSMYIRGGIALLKNVLIPAPASQAVADARSKQCASCPHNVFPDKNVFIKWIDDLTVAQVGERRASHHDKIGNCAICHCPLRAKVFETRSLKKFTDKELKPLREVSCWQLKLSGQDGN